VFDGCLLARLGEHNVKPSPGDRIFYDIEELSVMGTVKDFYGKEFQSEEEPTVCQVWVNTITGVPHDDLVTNVIPNRLEQNDGSKYVNDEEFNELVKKIQMQKTELKADQEVIYRGVPAKVVQIDGTKQQRKVKVVPTDEFGDDLEEVEYSIDNSKYVIEFGEFVSSVSVSLEGEWEITKEKKKRAQNWLKKLADRLSIDPKNPTVAAWFKDFSVEQRTLKDLYDILVKENIWSAGTSKSSLNHYTKKGEGNFKSMVQDMFRREIRRQNAFDKGSIIFKVTTDKVLNEASV
jgi:hypothetical protein